MISEIFKQNILKQDFTIGKPHKNGWYIVFTRSNDTEESYITDIVWFNSDSIGKFYIYCRCKNHNCQSTEFKYSSKIVAFKLFPKL